MFFLYMSSNLSIFVCVCVFYIVFNIQLIECKNVNKVTERRQGRASEERPKWQGV